MTQVSCFGSVIALNDNVTCRGCVFNSACTEAVGEKRESFKETLAEYYDMAGEPMLLPWLTKQERKHIRSHKRSLEAAKIAAKQFKRKDALSLLKRNIDLAHHGYIEEMLIENVNMTSLTATDFAHHSHPFGVISKRLHESGWALRPELVTDLTDVHHYTIKRARKELLAAERTLTVFRAVKKYGLLLERK